ncbi:792_t:CDS:2 [Entrophospora sp. SA101]|nr:12394_t:CDS:2 [Entrophospora sp. SA101]CAJ0851579.1 792_t:CDS:2 [Entrophospora sp. SA101]
MNMDTYTFRFNVEKYTKEALKNLQKNQQDMNNTVNDFQQQQLRSQIRQLETNPTQNQAELAAKKQQLKDLENKQKESDQQLPLTTQITILEREIKELEGKSRTQAEEALLISKKKELEELLKKQSDSIGKENNYDKTALVIGCGVIGVLLVLMIVSEGAREKYRLGETKRKSDSMEKKLLAQQDSLSYFLKNRETKEVILNRLIIPFKRPELIRKHIRKAVANRYGEGKYNVISNNCEHFATLCVAGIKFCSQVENLFNFNFKLDKKEINEETLNNDNFIAQTQIETNN